jgi:hypothetical protein
LLGEVNVTDIIRVENPSIDASVVCPDIVGRQAFDVGVNIQNTGNVTALLQVRFETKTGT